jgi:hypothetical protein
MSDELRGDEPLDDLLARVVWLRDQIELANWAEALAAVEALEADLAA